MPTDPLPYTLTKSLSGRILILADLVQFHFEPRLKEIGLTIVEYELLNAVAVHRDGVSQINAAKALRVSAPTMSEAVRSAVKREIISRTEDPEDRRIKKISITDLGHKKLRQCHQAMNDIEALLTSDMSREEKRNALNFLSALARPLTK